MEEHKCLNSELWHACVSPLCFLARFDPLLLFFLHFGVVAPFFLFFGATCCFCLLLLMLAATDVCWCLCVCVCGCGCCYWCLLMPLFLNCFLWVHWCWIIITSTCCDIHIILLHKKNKQLSTYIAFYQILLFFIASLNCVSYLKQLIKLDWCLY